MAPEMRVARFFTGSSCLAWWRPEKFILHVSLSAAARPAATSSTGP